MEILRRNNNLCFEITVDNAFIESDAACDFEAKHRTIIGTGKARLVEDEAAKTRGIDLIVAHFLGKKFTYLQANLNSTAVIRIDIESIKGKKTWILAMVLDKSLTYSRS